MLDPIDIPDLLANLVERSLVACDPVTGRHHMTESMRAYAMEHLDDEDAKARLRHFDYFTHAAEQIFTLTQTGEEAAAFLAFMPDSDNFRSAFEWSFANDPNACLHLTSCLFLPWQFWSPTESFQNSKRILEAAPNGAIEDQIWLRIQFAHSSMRRSDLPLAEELLTRVFEDLKINDIPAARAHALITLSWQKREAGDELAGLALIQEGLQVARGNDLPRYEALANTNLGEFARQSGDFDEAQRYYLEALAKCESKLRSALNLFNLGQVSIEKNDPDGAEQYYLQGLSCVEGPNIMPIAPGIISGLGAVHVLRGDYRRAGLLMGWSQDWRDHRGAKMDYTDRTLIARLHSLGEERGGPIFREAFGEGPKLTYDQIVTLARRSECKDLGQTR